MCWLILELSMKRVEDQDCKLEEPIVEVEAWHKVIEVMTDSWQFCHEFCKVLVHTSSVSHESPKWKP